MRTIRSVIQRHPVSTYFVLVLLISYGSFAVVVGPKLLRGGAEQASDAEYILFPILDLGVLFTTLALTGILEGASGLRNLFARMGRWRVNPRWYAVAILTPQVLALVVLLSFAGLISQAFTPKLFLVGALFGIPGIIEEIGWTGYAFPKMRMSHSALIAAVLLGVLWGLWHAPVVDYLGAAAPHGAYWLRFFLSFISIVTGMRVLISWVYTNTESLLLAQLMHVSMTASLVIFDPVGISPGQETAWYSTYAMTLWAVVGFVIARYGKRLVSEPAPVQTTLRSGHGERD
jgi:CAAX protease family protein